MQNSQKTVLAAAQAQTAGAVDVFTGSFGGAHGSGYLAAHPGLAMAVFKHARELEIIINRIAVTIAAAHLPKISTVLKAVDLKGFDIIHHTHERPAKRLADINQEASAFRNMAGAGVPRLAPS